MWRFVARLIPGAMLPRGFTPHHIARHHRQTLTYTSRRGWGMRELADYALSLVIAMGAVVLSYWAIVYLAH
jgi:hypothetical protein